LVNTDSSGSSNEEEWEEEYGTKETALSEEVKKLKLFL
jgi:hypothetical protein